MGLPLLGSVDQHDDTRFNRMQVGLVLSELKALAEVLSGENVVALGELITLAELVRERPHRYLLFVGD